MKKMKIPKRGHNVGLVEVLLQNLLFKFNQIFLLGKRGRCRFDSPHISFHGLHRVAHISKITQKRTKRYIQTIIYF